MSNMTRYSVKEFKAAAKRIIGSPNESSREEKALYSSVYTSVLNNPNTKYEFHFNSSIVHFGVPTKTIKVREHFSEFIDFLMSRCRVSNAEAIELINLMGNEPVRTNALKLDVGKVVKGRLVQAIEINGERHYCVPDDVEEQRSFVRGVFCDMVKMKELEAICPITEIDVFERNMGFSTVEKNLQNDTILYNFVHEI